MSTKTRPNKLGVGGIGRLEAEIMSEVWNIQDTTKTSQIAVREVYEAIRAKRQIAYTTVMTVMNNLAKKGLLKQEKDQVVYLYTPTKTKKILVAELKKAIDVVFS